MEFPSELKYTKDHEWVSTPKNNIVTVGISAYAIEQLGDIVNFDPPEIGAQKSTGETVATVESTKTVSDVYMPVEGEIVEINKLPVKDPEILQNAPYKDGWLFKIKIDDDTDQSHLLDSEAYATYIAEHEE